MKNKINEKKEHEKGKQKKEQVKVKAKVIKLKQEKASGHSNITKNMKKKYKT